MYREEGVFLQSRVVILPARCPGPQSLGGHRLQQCADEVSGQRRHGGGVLQRLGVVAVVQDALEGQVLGGGLEGSASGQQREEDAAQRPDVASLGGVLVL